MTRLKRCVWIVIVGLVVDRRFGCGVHKLLGYL